MTIKGFVCTSILAFGAVMTSCAGAPPDSAGENTRPVEDAVERPQELETDYLQSREGFTGERLGAEVEKVIIDEESPYQIIEVKVPIAPDRVDRVGIVSRSGERIKPVRSTDIEKDYENGNVGIKLYLPKEKNWIFKLKLIEEQDL